jgi:glucosamine--fructose-6-phosphate aminotransferase (isomerizing)
MNKFLKEIMEQPGTIDAVLEYYSSTEGLGSLKEAAKLAGLSSNGNLLFTGMGSSFFVSHAASTLFNELGLHSYAINTSELLHYNAELLNGKTTLICISQSGESYEVREITERFKPHVRCIAIVNNESSILAERSDIPLFCKAGPEEMTSTKTYVATSIAAFILGWYIAGKWDILKKKAVRSVRDFFLNLIENKERITDRMLEFMGDMDNLQVIARGPSYSAACQSALMFREALHLPAAATLGGEFRHGPMEMVKEGFRSILFAPAGKTYVQSIRMVEDIAGFGGKVLLFSNTNTPVKESGIMKIRVDGLDEYIFSLNAIFPAQLLVDSFARKNGFEAGSFSRGAKVTRSE